MEQSTTSPYRLLFLVSQKTGLPFPKIEERLIHLNRLPVGEIEHKLAEYYDEAAHIMVTYVGVLRHIHDLTKEEIPLDDPEAQERIRRVEIRLKAMTEKLDEVEKKIRPFSQELMEKTGTLNRVRLAEVEKCEDGLFILRFRKVDPESPIGLSYVDAVLIFVDTTPGKTGALAYVHQVPLS